MSDTIKLLVIAVAITVGMTLDYRDQQTQLTQELQDSREPTTPLSEIFKKHGSPAAESMAMAVAAVKPENRAIITAIAIVESNGNPKAVGDKGRSHGAWQVQPEHWGPVSLSPVQQALQAERILEDLVASMPRGSLRRGLAVYNGGVRPPERAWRYADRVIALSKKVQREI
jgi:hypothetical protein